MKMTHYLFIVLMAGTLALVGCGKSSKETAAPRQPGVVDLSALQTAFPDPNPDVKASLDKLRFSARYGQLEAELVELDKFISIPNLTEPQKKAVNDVIEQVKAAIQARPAAPAQ
jgi:hypothetical protein